MPRSRLETRVAPVECPATGNTQHCNVPQPLSFPLCHICLSVRVCATLLSWLRRLSFSSRNSIKQTRTRQKLRKLEMFVTFLIFCCPKMRSACTLWASSLQRVFLSLHCQQFKFLFKLSSSMIFQLNTFSLAFSDINICLLARIQVSCVLWGHFVSSFCFHTTFNVNICN